MKLAFFTQFEYLDSAMDIHDLTVNQLKRAVAIRERIEVLNKQLHSILGASTNSISTSTNSRGMSASVRRKIAAAQRARWTKLRRAKEATRRSLTRNAEPASRHNVVALRFIWQKRRAGRSFCSQVPMR